MKFSLLLSAVSILATSTLSYATTKYTLDIGHSNVGFKIPHLMISSVKGRFDKFEGDFMFDEKTGKLDNLMAKIDLHSINTNEAKRDAHLRNADFFNVENNNKPISEKDPKRWMTFTSTKTEVKNKKPVAVTGDLTLNGITKPVTLKLAYNGVVKDPWGNQKLGFEATGKISRKEYGLTWNKALETGGVVVGDEVTIMIDGEATAAATAVK